MPWKECSVLEARLRFVARLLEGERMSEVCRAFGIARKTGYKIFDRYREHGLEALSDRSRRPVRYANQAADHPGVRRGGGDPQQARALSRDPDRELAEEGDRRQADQPAHLSGASVRVAAVRASTDRTVAPGGERIARLVD
jgi:transposase-like protein